MIIFILPVVVFFVGAVLTLQIVQEEMGSQAVMVESKKRNPKP